MAQIEQKQQEEASHFITVGVVGAVAGLFGALLASAFMDKEKRGAMSEAIDGLTNSVVKAIAGFRKISEEFEELKISSQKKIEEASDQKYLRG